MSHLGWGHININVADLPRSVAFYEVLGFTRLMAAIPYLGIREETFAAVTPAAASALGLPAGVQARGCILQLGDGFPKLDLTEYELETGPGSEPFITRGPARLCLASRDIDADHARLCDAGVPFLTPPASGEGDSARIATCVDPDGTLIELIQLVPENWARLMQ